MQQAEIQEDIKLIVKECIIANTNVRIEADDQECIYAPKGQALEVGLIQFLMDNELDASNLFISRNREQPIKVMLPFD